MKKGILLVIIGALLVTAAFTNPGQDMHREAVRVKIMSNIQQSMADGLAETDSDWKIIGQAFGMMLGNSLVERLVNTFVSTDNYLIFSTTKVNWDGESNIIGIGVFGNVFITGKLDEVMDKDFLLDRIRP